MHQLFVTDDGSHSVIDPKLNVTFHSSRGAVAESLHIFINYGLKAMMPDSNSVSILEMGFGTGLNALLTLIEVENTFRIVRYESIETSPVNYDIYSNLNYCQVLGRTDKQQEFIQLHSAPWNQCVQLTKSFMLKKIHDSMERHVFDNNYDLVFWDAFDPSVQPELWSTQIFKRVRNRMHVGSILLTYSSKVIVQRALKEAGFNIEKLQGPRGKREIIRATAI